MSEQARTRLQAASLMVATALTIGGWVWVLAGNHQNALHTLDEHESRLKAVELDQRQSASAIAEIKTDVRWIRQMMEHRP